MTQFVLNHKTYSLDEKQGKLININNPKDVIELTGEEAENYKQELIPFDDYKELACGIIDDVSELIEEKYNIEPKILSEGDEIDNPALLNGKTYYTLEDEIAEKIKGVVMKRRMRLVHKELAR